MNYQSICRVCLNVSYSDMLSVFDSYNFSSLQSCEIFKVIINCASVKIEKSDGFSVKICRRCLEHLSQAYSFKKLCEESDYKFRNNLIAGGDIEIKNEFYEEDAIIDYGEIHNTEIPTDQFDNKSELNVEDTIINFGVIHDHNYDTDKEAKNVELPKTGESSISLPEHSREVYEKQFQRFQCWCARNNLEDVAAESTLLTYFEEEGKTKKCSSMLVTYSILRSCLNIYKNADITKYAKLQAFMKMSSAGYEPKKSKILEAKDIDRFIKKADDQLYLAMKIILIMGYNGGCRRVELTNMLIDDIECKSDVIIVKVRKSKNYLSRFFSITEKTWVDLVKKYVSLRPKTVTHRRFFLTYRNGHCVSSPIGINTMGKMPKFIANYLKLPNPDLFSGQCFKRSSRLAKKDCNIVTIKHNAGWKSSALSNGQLQVELTQMLSSRPSTSSASQSDTIR